ncbi:MAG: 2-polyprenylphenol 6-hydroxylase [Alphaproteobacteria bacterium GM202ARS2]|nr:2-polyprenylphenol 6-hydroxylase [Alphaproteobacteria bacterium GM202ARS2]
MSSVSLFARLLRIVFVLVRHDLGFVADIVPMPRVLKGFFRVGRLRAGRKKETGKRLARALTTLGPGFIKLGQMMATRSDVVGTDVARELVVLQDKLPPFSTKQALRIIEADLGAPWQSFYEHVEAKPVAAASIAQVHFAVTRDGKEVAVKVLRPDVARIFARDFALFRWLAALIDRHRPDLHRLRLPEVVGVLENVVRTEMDLRMEAASASEMKKTMAADARFYIPSIDWQRTGKRVLTMERIDGVRVDHPSFAESATLGRDKIVVACAQAFFRQLFIDGFFHADLHPGNVLIDKRGRIVLVDFGIMGRLDRMNRAYLADIFLAFLREDYKRVADVHFKAGWVPSGQSREAFASAVRAVGEPIVGKALESISMADLLAQLFAVATEFEMGIQPQLVMMQKAMLVTEGVSRTLYPQANMWALVRPLIAEWQKEHQRFDRQLKELVGRAASVGEELPERVMRLLRHLDGLSEQGVKLHPETVEALARSLREGGRAERGRVSLWRVVGGTLIGVLCAVGTYTLIVHGGLMP